VAGLPSKASPESVGAILSKPDDRFACAFFLHDARDLGRSHHVLTAMTISYCCEHTFWIFADVSRVCLVGTLIPTSGQSGLACVVSSFRCDSSSPADALPPSEKVTTAVVCSGEGPWTRLITYKTFSSDSDVSHADFDHDLSSLKP
jgi:hypothetical protein